MKAIELFGGISPDVLAANGPTATLEELLVAHVDGIDRERIFTVVGTPWIQQRVLPQPPNPSSPPRLPGPLGFLTFTSVI